MENTGSIKPATSLSNMFKDVAAIVEKSFPNSQRPDVVWRAKTNQRLSELYLLATRELNVSQMIECGAHAAEASLSFISLSASNKAVALEANPFVGVLYAPIVQNASLSYIFLAAGECLGVAELHLPKNTRRAWGSTGKASLKSRVSGPHQEAMYGANSISIGQTTVDAITHSHLTEADFAIWIDVEGAAREVLLGMTEALKNRSVAVMLLEVETHNFWSDAALASEIDSFLRKHGMVLVAMDAQYWPGQCNAIYVRKGDLQAVEHLVQKFWTNFSNLVISTRLELFNHAVRRFTHRVRRHLKALRVF